MIKGIKPMVKVVSFHPHIIEHSKSVFLGFACFILTYKGIRGDDGDDLCILLRDVTVKMLGDACTPHYDYAARRIERSDRWIPLPAEELPKFVFEGIEDDRQHITDAIFSTTKVREAVLLSAERLVA